MGTSRRTRAELFYDEQLTIAGIQYQLNIDLDTQKNATLVKDRGGRSFPVRTRLFSSQPQNFGVLSIEFHGSMTEYSLTLDQQGNITLIQTIEYDVYLSSIINPSYPETSTVTASHQRVTLQEGYELVQNTLSINVQPMHPVIITQTWSLTGWGGREHLIQEWIRVMDYISHSQLVPDVRHADSEGSTFSVITENLGRLRYSIGDNPFRGDHTSVRLIAPLWDENIGLSLLAGSGGAYFSASLGFARDSLWNVVRGAEPFHLPDTNATISISPARWIRFDATANVTNGDHPSWQVGGSFTIGIPGM